MATGILLMTGCALYSPTGNFEDKTPTGVFESPYGYGTITVCLTDAWQNMSKNVNVTPMVNGNRIIAYNPTAYRPIGVIELTGSLSGSLIKYWDTSLSYDWTDKSWFTKYIEICAGKEIK